MWSEILCFVALILVASLHLAFALSGNISQEDDKELSVFLPLIKDDNKPNCDVQDHSYCSEVQDYPEIFMNFLFEAERFEKLILDEDFPELSKSKEENNNAERDYFIGSDGREGINLMENSRVINRNLIMNFQRLEKDINKERDTTLIPPLVDEKESADWSPLIPKFTPSVKDHNNAEAFELYPLNSPNSLTEEETPAIPFIPKRSYRINNVHQHPYQTNFFRRKRDSESKSVKACPTKSKVIKPKVALSSKGVWMFVVNTQQISQSVVIEKCITSRCFGNCHPHSPPLCMPHFTQKRLLAISPQGTSLTYESFWMPVGCNCEISSS